MQFDVFRFSGVMYGQVASSGVVDQIHDGLRKAVPNFMIIVPYNVSPICHRLHAIAEKVHFQCLFPIIIF